MITKEETARGLLDEMARQLRSMLETVEEASAEAKDLATIRGYVDPLGSEACRIITLKDAVLAIRTE